ncbi:hypothetical protein BH10ACI1_BH10ACI1_26150 [soil metagenome]
MLIEMHGTDLEKKEGVDLADYFIVEVKQENLRND